MTLRVLGVDPGLTRCGVGVIDVEPNRKARLVHVSVIRSDPELDLEKRLLGLGAGLESLLAEYRPDAVALERVFAQQNLRTVMGTAQASGVVLLLAARQELAVGLHTPSEVKASVTGYGSADKKQVATMVARILGLATPPTPADASDALALAICHGWNLGTAQAGPSANSSLTPAQRAWRAAERKAPKSAAARRVEP
ncbi:crossover junction endodeoxyribonuclease RuvC [Homoserinimonas sp. A447]